VKPVFSTVTPADFQRTSKWAKTALNTVAGQIRAARRNSFFINIETANFGCDVVETLLEARQFADAKHYAASARRYLDAAEVCMRKAVTS